MFIPNCKKARFGMRVWRDFCAKRRQFETVSAAAQYQSWGLRHVFAIPFDVSKMGTLGRAAGREMNNYAGTDFPSA
jgi:hypothetical protein